MCVALCLEERSCADPETLFKDGAGQREKEPCFPQECLLFWGGGDVSVSVPVPGVEKSS